MGSGMTYQHGNKDGKHYWLTHPICMNNSMLNLSLTLIHARSRVMIFLTGLLSRGKSNYVNPPFNGPTKLTNKCLEEFQKGNKVVFVFPIDKWVHRMIEASSEIRNLGDVR